MPGQECIWRTAVTRLLVLRSRQLVALKEYPNQLDKAQVCGFSGHLSTRVEKSLGYLSTKVEKSLVSGAGAYFLTNGAPGGRSRREARIRGRVGSYHADLTHVRNTRVCTSSRVEKSLVSEAGAHFLTERESSVGAGASP